MPSGCVDMVTGHRPAVGMVTGHQPGGSGEVAFGTGRRESCPAQVAVCPGSHSCSDGGGRLGRGARCLQNRTPSPLEGVRGPGGCPRDWRLPGDRLSLPFTAANPLLCSTARYHCKNGLCIDKSFICDGQDNCQDNSDEESCESSQGRTRGRSRRPLPHPRAPVPTSTRTHRVHALDPTALARLVPTRSTSPCVLLVLNSTCTSSRKWSLPAA